MPILFFEAKFAAKMGGSEISLFSRFFPFFRKISSEEAVKFLQFVLTEFQTCGIFAKL